MWSICNKMINFAFPNDCTQMAQQLTIKQIAQKAGVSVGTVDRILHNRGSVSAEAMEAVQAVLRTCNYRKNIHKSAVAFKKSGRSVSLVVAIPSSPVGEYWDLVRKGISRGLNEYGDITIDCKFAFYNQFDSFSCQEAFNSILESNVSSVIISPIFVDETIRFCNELDKRGVPYFFVDGNIPECHPVGTFMADQAVCGRLMARMVDSFTPADAEVAIFLPKRVGALMSNNSLIRTRSFREHYAAINPSRVLKEGYYSTDNPDNNILEINEFFRENPNVKGIAVMISTGYLISDALAAVSRADVCVGGYDVTDGNARCIREDSLTFIINQHPEQHGFNCVESLLHYLLYGSMDSNPHKALSIDVVLKENI